MAKAGDTIKIINMVGESKYNGKIGKVYFIDGMGQLHGSWGSLAVQPDKDAIVVIKENELCK